MNNGQPTMAERMGAVGPGAGLPQLGQQPQGYPQQQPQGYPQQQPQGYPQQPPQQMPPMQMLPPPGTPQLQMFPGGVPLPIPQPLPQAYAPNVGPNPPENGLQMPSKEEDEGGDEGGAKTGPGRPKGSRNKTLSIEQHVFMLGVQGVLSNPNINPTNADTAAQYATLGGDLAVRVFHQKFGG